MLIEINAQNPDDRKVNQIVEILRKGGTMIYPTDTVYGLGCDIFNQKAIERICKLRGLNPAKAYLTIICKDLSQLAEYTQQIDNQTFKLLKRNLPGSITFIFKSSRKVPKLFKNKRKTVGIRIPKNNIDIAILEKLGNPILSISLKSDDEIVSYFTNPSEIHDDYAKKVDVIIDGGNGKNTPSTIVDLSSSEPEIIRLGEESLIW